MTNDTFAYIGEFQLNDGSIDKVNLDERGWADPNRLANTRVFSLVPKDRNSRWPYLRINIPEGAKPIFKSRNNVGMTAGFVYRIYAAGWIKDGVNHWTWLFPTGAVEQETDDPSINKEISAQLNDQWRDRIGRP